MVQFPAGFRCNYGFAVPVVLVLLLVMPVAAMAADWFDEQAAASAAGAPEIRVSLGQQRAYFYKGDTPVGESRISSGKPGFRTPAGHYRVLAKKVHHRSGQFGSYVDRNSHRVVRADVDRRRDRRPPGTYYRGAKMDYFIRFNDGIGFHASSDVPDYPASHGCVRMPRNMAQKFFQYAPVGTPVVVTN
ncbi:L,D-transpeptidase [Microbulbifer sp. SAOS-129_SWC]|uniref:L,D-transpeptidase n=1 Tax=Microbulbifer sp. SAOS-129_SWC TaxID=3145235 RepID=UPI00321802A6